MLLDNHHGPDRRIAYETRLLSQEGIAVRVAAWDRRIDARTMRVRVHGAEVLRVAAPARHGHAPGALLALLRFSLGLWRRRHHLFDDAALLMVHDVYLLPVGRLVACLWKLPFVYDAHEEYARMEATRYPNWVLRAVAALETRLARRAALVVVPGQSRLDRWSREGFKNLIVLRNVGSPPAAPGPQHQSFDLLHAGTLSTERRIDLLIEAARRYPALRVGIAGSGKLASEIEREVSSLPNVTYFGWRDDIDTLIPQARALYYGLDPEHPDAETACPNTLFQALFHRRPIVYFGGGEIDRVNALHKIGVRTDADPDAVAMAANEVIRAAKWEFDAALSSLEIDSYERQWVSALKTASRG